jgi:hypothetical protein
MSFDCAWLRRLPSLLTYAFNAFQSSNSRSHSSGDSDDSASSIRAVRRSNSSATNSLVKRSGRTA